MNVEQREKKIIEIYDSGLASFREIGELPDIQLPMCTVRRIYRRSKGKDFLVEIKKYDKLSEVDTKYIENWKEIKKGEDKLREKDYYWLKD